MSHILNRQLSSVARVLCGLFLWALISMVPVSALEPPGRVIAVGDIHGEYEGLTRILREAELIDDSNQWTGGDAILVQTGDYTDRGPDVRKVIDLLMDLEKQAPQHGGQVIALMGNHESMNLLADYRDVSDATFATFATEESDQLREDAYKAWVKWMKDLARTRGQIPPQVGKRQEGGVDGRASSGLHRVSARDGTRRATTANGWPARPVVVKVGDTLFMHAGISPDYVDSSIEEINQLHWDDDCPGTRDDREALAKAGVALQPSSI